MNKYVSWAMPVMLFVALVAATPLQAVVVLEDDFNDGVLDTSKWSTFLGGAATIVEENGVVKLRKGASSIERPFLATVGEWEPTDGEEITVSGKITLNNNSYFAVWVRAADYFDPRPWNGVADFGVVCEMAPNAAGKVKGFEKLPGTDWTPFGNNATPSDGTVNPPYWEFSLADNGTDVTFTVTEAANPGNTATFTGSSTLSEGKFHVLFTGHDIELDEVTISTGVSNQWTKPLIRKLGTIDCNMVETSPIVFNNKLYRYESVRSEHASNTTGDTYSRFVDVAAGTTTSSFAAGYDFGSAFVKDGTMYVYVVQGWGNSTIYELSSTDLQTWSSPRPVLEQPTDWKIYNTSVCKAQERYVMAFDIGEPPSVVGTRFTTRFAESTDLINWTLLSEEDGIHGKDKYVGCPVLRFLDDGYFYMIYLEHILSPRSFEAHIVRSTDLVDWESSPLNPVLQFSDEDKQTGNPESHPHFYPNGDPTQAQLDHIEEIVNCNNSDVDLCEFDGKVFLYYSWGNQYANGNFLAEAVYDGTLDSFLRGWFEPPEPIPGDANDDGIVNDEDASILAAHWQQTGMSWEHGDFNDDGIVNDADASILAAHWLETGEEGTPVPEPSGVVLLLGGMVLLFLLTWCRGCPVEGCRIPE